MNLLRPIVAQPQAVLVREAILLAVIVVLAVVATAIFNGIGTGPSFELTRDPFGAYPW